MSRLDYESKIDHLDLSWTKEYIRSINSQTLLECEPMETIQLKFVYVNAYSKIDLVEQEECKLVFDTSSNGSWLPEATVLRIIQNRKTIASTGHRYKLGDILSYVVMLDPMHLSGYSAEKGGSVDGLKTISTIGAIHIPSSFFIFHRINTIYFIFRQLVRLQTVGTGIGKDIIPLASSIPLSILKTGKEPSKKTTKRVRISPVLPKHGRSNTSKIRIID